MSLLVGVVLLKKKMGSRERVLSFLDHTAPEEFSPKTISVRCSINRNSIKKICQRLQNEGLIEKTIRGFYRGKLSVERMIALENVDIKIHGIKIEFHPTTVYKVNGRNVTERGEGLSLCHLLDPKDLIYQDNSQMVYEREFLGRTVTIQLHKGVNLAGIFVKATEAPLDYNEFRLLRAFLEGMLGTAFILGSPELVQVGLNKDTSELRLDGVKSVKLQAWENAWAQIYQKAEHILRREVHLVTRIGLDDACRMLEDMKERGDRAQKEGAVRAQLAEEKQAAGFDHYMYG